MKSSTLLIASMCAALGACGSKSEPGTQDMSESDMTPRKTTSAVVATMTNASPNSLLAYPMYSDGTIGTTPQTLALGGNGGAAGNAHGMPIALRRCLGRMLRIGRRHDE